VNTKALATIIVAILLIGTFGLTLNIVPKTSADTVYYTLKIDYAPKPMIGGVVPATAPPVGSDSYTAGSQINISAPATVSAGVGIQYVFQNWTFHDDTNNVTDGSTSNPVYTTSPLDRNWTATAMYNLQYLFTVSTTHTWPALILYVWVPGTVWVAEQQQWFDAGTTGVGAGLNLYEDDVAWGHKWVHTGWSGDASGGGGADSYKNITMDQPRTAIANWVEEYYLWTISTYVPWGDAQPPYDPDHEGWKPNPTDVPLSAPQISNEIAGVYRWNFTRWEIYRYNESSSSFYLDYTTGGVGSYHNITVHVNAFTKAVVIYQLQYYLTVLSSPGALDLVEYQSGYYDYGSYVTLTAPQHIADPTDPVGARWNFSWWWISAVLFTTSRITTVQILGVYTAYAGYTKQYHMTIKTTPALILSMPNVYFTQTAADGWYNAGGSCTFTALNTTIYTTPAMDTKYVFDDWYFPPDGRGTLKSNVWTISGISQAWNATAEYHKEYKATAICDPVDTGGPWAINLNTWNGWPVAGFEWWAGENSLVGWSALSGPVYGYPFYYYFDYWTITNATGTFNLPKGQNSILGGLNFTGPMTTVAHYAGKSAFFTSPMTIPKTVPSYCTNFDVNVTCANIVDMYALDFNVTWNPTLFELVSSNVRVREIWNQSIYWENNKLPGNYHLVATQTAPGLGFNGTHTIVTLTFHIIYDPCYVTPYYSSCAIGLVGPAFGGTYPMLTNSLGNAMYPWMVDGSTYRIDAIQPILYMVPSTKTVSQKDVTFTVEIWIRNATKLKDYNISVWYDNTLLEVTNVVVDTGFLTGPYSPLVVDYTSMAKYVHVSAAQKQPGNVLANGTGRLFTIYFHVIKSIFWTKGNPTLTCNIHFSWVYTPTISVMCPAETTIGVPDLGTENCLYTYKPIEGDVDKNGIVNSLDLQLVAADYGSSTTYDLNGDTHVDLLDIVLVAINFGKTSPGY